MARANSKNIKRLIAEATELATNKYDAERKLDADHIAEHIKASEDAIARMEAIESMMRDLILFEKERLKALQGHHNDIITTEPDLVESSVTKRLN